MGGTAPLGAILVSLGAIISKGAKGGDFKILKLTLEIFELQMKSKKKVLGVLNGSLVGGQ